MPLITERPTRNVATLRNGVANFLVQRRNIVRKLLSNAGDKLLRMAGVTTTTREEKASSETLFLKAGASNRTGNCGLSSAGQTVEPKDATAVESFSPFVYLSKKIDAGTGEAGRLVLCAI